MKPPQFEYRRVLTIEDAIGALAENENTAILAGGQSLIPTLNFRLGMPDSLIDISRIPSLSRIELTETEIKIGAMVRQRQVELRDDIKQANPILRETLAHVAHLVIRNRGTLVGSLAHADAAAELPAVLLTCGGRVAVVGPDGERSIAADDFFRFHLTTDLKPNELITAASFPVLPPDAGWAFGEIARRRGDYAIAGVCVILRIDSSGNCTDANLGACGIASRPVRLLEAEQILIGNRLEVDVIGAAGEAAREAVQAPGDNQASLAYRQQVLATLVRRNVARAAARAGAPHE